MVGRVVWRAGAVFDGTAVLGPGWVMVEGGVIVAVEDVSVPPPEDAAVVDFGQAFLMPGLIDAHVHLCMNAAHDVVDVVTEAADDVLMDTAREAALVALRAGITTVRDLGDRSYVAARVREEYSRLGAVGPQLVVAGPPVTVAGGHCHFLGGAAEGWEALRAAVRDRAERGCDVLKVMASGGEMTAGSAAHRAQYRRDELEFLVGEARRWGMTTAAHAHGVQSVDDAVAAGFHTIEHASFITEDRVVHDRGVVDRIVASGTVISATLGFHPDPDGLKARYTNPTRIATRRELHSRGVPIVVGTDAGIHPSKPYDVLPHGIADLRDYGMSTVEALRSATRVAAAACGLAGSKGRLAAGYDADLLVVARSPAEDLAALLEVTAVARAGVRVR